MLDINMKSYLVFLKQRQIFKMKSAANTEGRNLAIYFGDSQLGRNRIFNFIKHVSNIYVNKRQRVR